MHEGNKWGCTKKITEKKAQKRPRRYVSQNGKIPSIDNQDKKGDGPRWKNLRAKELR